MFDIGFSELLLIGVIALIVLGPERLPKVARTLGALLGRLNRYASQVKQDIDREIQLDELRKVQKDMQETAQKYEIMANQRVQEVEATVREEVAQVDKAIQDPQPAETGPALLAATAGVAVGESKNSIVAESPATSSAGDAKEADAKPPAVADHGPAG